MTGNGQHSKTPVTFVRLPKATYDTVRKMAKEQDRTIAYIIRALVESSLKK